MILNIVKNYIRRWEVKHKREIGLVFLILLCLVCWLLGWVSREWRSAYLETREKIR